MNKLIYLDYASTTPIDKRVLEKMNNYLTTKGLFGNSSSSNYLGRKTKNEIENARIRIANILGSKQEEIFFTSNATESINLAIKGIIYSYFNNKKKYIITSSMEHKAVLETCNFLKKLGIKIIYITNSNIGVLNLNLLKEKIINKTILVSVMHINNEIGTINNIKNIGNICKKKNVFFHVDATQSIGKYSLNLKKMNIDLLSFSAHKFYGPKGIGVLYVKKKKPKIILTPLLHGGGQEKGLRSGTLATHQIIGMSTALIIADNEIKKEKERIKILKKKFWNEIRNIPGIFLNGSFKNSSPYIINIGCKDIFNKILMLEMNNIIISSSSACNSNKYNTSHVLKSLGLTKELIQSSIRISFGRFTTEKEIIYLIKELHFFIKKIRQS
ncbi:aminotransferase class V-fold PLP-dependent enzyme [Enterobacteriaceae endosymbiont of Donacia bicoloricornis]|uniref:cysteine desulfurase family protein n=1 Tax=Enterobacteriaceae endosymbiont of Donacia bicoloricornis TaxID=2675772 RepID=UPI001449EF4A|nr:cysteine desulfurase family protein [Enterobacteriaceae endosymbiont of Donacia bicoloricornis]QJC37858.1 aminotransferase class V-fold PLP-dependent enzyme [Enterobacteriaceae endosymbiont of Donacia bicoloricornis]